MNTRPTFDPLGTRHPRFPRRTALILALCSLSLPSFGEVVLEADDNTATLSGSWSQSTGTPGFYGSDFATSVVGGAAASARFFSPRPISTSGSYCIQAHWTAGSNRSASARYEVYDGSTLRGSFNADQRSNGGAWRTLGCVALTAGRTGEVRLLDSSGAAGSLVVADGVRWVWEESAAQSLCVEVNGGQAQGGGSYVGQGYAMPARGSCKPWSGFMKTGTDVVGYSSGSGCTSSDGQVLTLTLATVNPRFFGTGAVVSDFIRICSNGAGGCPLGVVQGDTSSYFGLASAQRVSCTPAMLELPAGHN